MPLSKELTTFVQLATGNPSRCTNYMIVKIGQELARRSGVEVATDNQLLESNKELERMIEDYRIIGNRQAEMLQSAEADLAKAHARIEELASLDDVLLTAFQHTYGPEIDASFSEWVDETAVELDVAKTEVSRRALAVARAWLAFRAE